MTDYLEIEKKALVAILKFLAHADGKLTENEIVQFQNLAEKKGFKDFRKIFKKVDSEIKTLNDFSSYVNSIFDKEKRLDILQQAIEMAGVDYITSEEKDIIRYLSRVWEIPVEKLNP